MKLKNQRQQQRQQQQKPQNKLSVVNLDTLDKYIVVLKNQLTESLCDAILNEYSHTDEWTSTVIGADAKEDKTQFKLLIKQMIVELEDVLKVLKS